MRGNGRSAPALPMMLDLNSDVLTLNRQIGKRGVVQIFEGHLGDHPVIALGEESAKVTPLIARNQPLVEEWRAFEHPNYLKFLGITEKQGMTLFVHASLPAKSLAVILKEQPVLPLEQALVWFLEMLSVVDAFHRRGKVHGFLSPSSFVVGRSESGAGPAGSVFLFDYPAEALVKRATCLELQVLPFSAMAYSAPEVVRREDILPESDYFSLGAILARMLTGRFPFGDSFGRPDERAVLSGMKPDLNANITLPRSLVLLLERLLDKNPATRLANADEVRGWINAILAEYSGERRRRSPGLRSRLKSLFSFLYSVALLLGILVLLTGGYMIYTTFFRSESLVTVPNLIGKNFEDAKPQAASFRLRLVREGQQFSAVFPENIIIKQEPEAGTRIQASSVIKVITSKGPLKVKVPDLRGMTVEEARKQLEAAKLVIGTEIEESGPPPAGRIMRQSPEPGIMVISGERVNVWLSSGKGQNLVVMPDLTGFSIRLVLEALAPLGLELAEVRWKHRPGIHSEHVVSQYPEPETEVPASTKVTVEGVRPEGWRGKATLLLHIPPSERPVRLTIRVTDSRGASLSEFMVSRGIFSQELDFVGSATVEAILEDRILRRESFE